VIDDLRALIDECGTAPVEKAKNNETEDAFNNFVIALEFVKNMVSMGAVGITELADKG